MQAARSWFRRLRPAGARVSVTMAALLFLLPPGLEGQLASRSDPQPGVRPRVFLDCQAQGPGRWSCDADHFRTEITFVDWVSEPAASDVHVIVTSTGVGGGGNRFTLDFMGRRGMDGMNDRLTYTSSGTDVQAETVDGVTQALRMGLLRYAVESGQGRHFELLYHGPGPREPLDGDGGANGDGFLDPWDYWTFRFGLSGNVDIQERRREQRLNPQLNVNRVTDNWKVNSQLWANLRRESVELSDGREVRNDQNSWRASLLVVRAITDHVSVGVDSRVANSIRFNQRARLAFQPAVEWNYYPYREANRRQFIAHYSTGVEYSSYYETTVFDKDRELLPQHRMAVQYRAREPWGNAGLSFDVSQYLHNTGFYSYGLSADLSYRVLRGLELNVSGGASKIADELYTRAEDLSDEDILLGRVSLPSSFRYDASIGFSYRWGSALTNIVNNRFPSSVRDG